MKTFEIKNVTFETGHFPGEGFKLFEFTLLEKYIGLNDVWWTYLHIQVGRYIINITESWQ
jgi:hypothetical protein